MHYDVFKIFNLIIMLYVCVYNLKLWCIQTHIYVFFFFFCHCYCSLLDTTMVFSLILYVIIGPAIKIKIWATDALTPHSTSNSTTLPSAVFLSVSNVCTKKTSDSCSKISPLEKTDFILKKCTFKLLKN